MSQLSGVNYGVPDDCRRMTTVIKDKIYEELKAVSYWERLTIKEIVEAALTEYLHNMPDRAKRMP